jgi:1-acyl-sn-glycerol-3-phosphate acyltransferase
MPNPVRLAVQLIRLVAKLLWIAIDFAWLALRSGGSPSLRARTIWLQRSSKRMLHLLAVAVETHGPPPTVGLLVSNHLTYLDILVLVAIAPAVFVSKSEVRHWPVFGWFSRLGGTLYVDRARRSDVGRLGGEIRDVLRGGHVVVLFPEGTSSDGHDVLPFKSSLLEPVSGAQYPLTVAHIGYALADGSVENDICYWGDMTFFPHFIKLLTKRGIRARVRFAPVEEPAAQRKDLARQLHAEVIRLKNLTGGVNEPPRPAVR